MNTERTYPENTCEYTVTDYYFGKTTPQVTQISFELSFHGWYRLQETAEWHHLLEVVAELQK